MKKGCFRHHHADCYFCRGNSLFVVKQLRQSYNFYETPPIVTKNSNNPYTMMKKDIELEWLSKNEETIYTAIKNIVAAIIKLDGTFDSKLIRQLKKTISSQKITEQQCKQIIKHLFTKIHPRWVPHMLSVCLFIYLYFYAF